MYIRPFLVRDMVLLENQVPLLVLTKLIEVEKGASEPNEYLAKLVIKFVLSLPYAWKLGRCKHLLDIYRKCLLMPNTRIRHPKVIYPYDGDYITTIPSATELLDAGIRFKRSKTGNLRDVSFHQNTLRLPMIFVDYETKSILLNLITFEQFHVDASPEVSSYIFFLNSLVKGSQDVSLLPSCGIIINGLGDDEDVAEIFNLL
ncbi:UNVERIFIED_CONTAM: hypothetical protein Sangu_0526500 [Sesamum angustifolium]|uniref:Uncharacterized protein n=1 Tax=Sesamum angustifolium TaxID=2727405 RepID=A0AAW2Q947_9LAMI